MSTVQNFEWRSKIYNEKGQTAIPKQVRMGLGLEVGDEVVYKVNEEGNIVIGAAKSED